MISAVSPGGEADTGRAGGFHCRGDADAAVPLLGLITSGNDAAIALAEGVASSDTHSWPV